MNNILPCNWRKRAKRRQKRNTKALFTEIRAAINSSLNPIKGTDRMRFRRPADPHMPTHQQLNCHTNESANISTNQTVFSLPKSRQNAYCLICTPRRRPIEIRAQIDPQTLTLANIPGRHVRPLGAFSAPSQRIALKRKLAKSILGGRKSDRQIRRRSVRLLADVGVQDRAGLIDQLDKLAVQKVVLASGLVVGEDGAAGRGVQR